MQDTVGIGWGHLEFSSLRLLQGPREKLRQEHVVHEAEEDGEGVPLWGGVEDQSCFLSLFGLSLGASCLTCLYVGASSSPVSSLL